LLVLHKYKLTSNTYKVEYTFGLGHIKCNQD